MREKIEQIIEQSFDVVRIGNKVYYTSKSKSDEKFKRRIEELLTLHGVVSSKSQIKTKQEIIDLIKEDIGYVFDQQIEVEQLNLCGVSKSLPKYLQKCNRVEVIDQKGRSYVNWKPTNKVEISLQDDDRTAKIFITG